MRPALAIPPLALRAGRAVADWNARIVAGYALHVTPFGQIIADAAPKSAHSSTVCQS